MAKATMKAAIVHDFGKPPQIEEVPIPRSRPDEIPVEVRDCGLSHAYPQAPPGDWPAKPSRPCIPCHEAAGVAVEAGVTGRTFGDAVGLASAQAKLGHMLHERSNRLRRDVKAANASFPPSDIKQSEGFHHT
ncbi:hypothetical protein [Aminobacter sp. HY435]|uniref:hypothetical protein n=1 Tax=Aminobacter sp. HY435 TaxID=2970917 RepID=UPI0022B9C81E|nr:hypothetical protein [Aminobacter sp. HY435]